MFWIPRPLHRDLGDGALDLAEIVGRELDGDRPDVLLEPLQLRGSCLVRSPPQSL